MARRKKLIAFFIAMTALATAHTAVAGSFSISPIRVELSPQQKTEALTVRNESSSREVVVQAQAFEWTQRDGHDSLTPTRDVLVTPPVFTLTPNAQQIVRVAVRKPADPKRELTYRLILQEVPPEAPKNFTGLQVALRLSLPIFIAPSANSEQKLAWRSHWLPDGTFQVDVTNQGDVHAQVIDFTVQAKGSDAVMRNSVVKYVLPGATTTFALQPPQDAKQLAALKQGTLVLRGASDRGEITAELSAVSK